MFINGDDYDTPDGTTIRDFIHVSDLADIHYLCARYIMEKKFQIFLIVVMEKDLVSKK